ncbi:16S rRNA (adenine(1518)-N(6)/adenine(1519)-N(6))-dimethyltransferase RsmA, partial [Anaplasma platys]|uniref:16S rRNA (adenine(1518)-N(6)/adenine(1519)-N(6))- dimethyltransferase RsmA n=1 Tax=Anaplasma platys TaxID=949 RepID=UPI00145CB638
MNTVTSRKHRAKKSLGQNFILAPSIGENIVSFAGCIEGYDIIEVGPGLGTMTQAIIKGGVRKLVSIEKDESLAAVHNKLEKAYPSYKCIYQDILDIDIRSLELNPPIKMIANLPYNISVVLLLKLLDSIQMFEKLTLMFQKEVANRIVAVPGTKGYSTLSVLVQLLCSVEKVADFPPEVFSPAPKVHSS